MNDRLSELRISQMSFSSSDDGAKISQDSPSSSLSSTHSTPSSTSSKRRWKKLKPKNPFKKGSKGKAEPTGESPTILDMTAFFASIQTIQSNVGNVTKATTKVNTLCGDALACLSVEKEKKISEKLEKVVLKTNKTIKASIASLQRLQNDTEAMANTNKSDTTEKEIAVRKNVIAATSQQLKDESAKYRHAQEEYRTEIETKMKRQIKIVDPSITQEALDTLMTSEDGAEGFMQQKMLQKKRKNKSKI